MALTQVSTDGVKDGSLLNADINASAAISKSKIENLINNNADNRVITGSGTANTLEGESGLIFDGTNLGVGITPDSHGGTVKSLQIGTATNLYNETSDDYTILGNNVYLDGSNNKYIKTQESSRLMQNAGEFTFQQAVSGSADANITYTTPLKIDSSGKVGIGTTSPSSALEVSRASGDTIFELNRSNSNVSGNVGCINFTASDGHSVGSIGMLGDGDDQGADIVFRTTSAAADNSPFNAATPERMRIDSSGQVGIGTTSPSNKLHVEDSASGVIIAKQTTNNGGFNTFEGKASGGTTTFYASHNGRVGAADGIIFGSDTAAANILDDYEEGTWTPVFSDDGTSGNNASSYNTQIGWYTKIGNLVNIQMRISNAVFSSFNTSHALYIKGLPYTIEAASGRLSTGHCLLSKCNLDSDTMGIGVISNTGSGSFAYFRLFQTKDNATWVSIKVSQWTSGENEIVVNMTYRHTS
jgi:hypothetical protein